MTTHHCTVANSGIGNPYGLTGGIGGKWKGFQCRSKLACVKVARTISVLFLEIKGISKECSIGGQLIQSVAAAPVRCVERCLG